MPISRKEGWKIALAYPGTEEVLWFNKPAVFLHGQFLTKVHDKEEAMTFRVSSMEMRDMMLEAEVAGARASCLAESSEGIGRELGQGSLQAIILEYEAGMVLVNAAGPGAMLATVLCDPAMLGKIRYSHALKRSRSWYLFSAR